MWVCVSNDFDVKRIVTNIIACTKKKAHSEDAMEQLQSELRAEIDGKRYLLVLDDLWNEEPEKWLSLKKLLVGGARGSKILITTRLTSVAKITGTAPPHLLGGLSDSVSLDLLMQMAYRKEEEIQDPEMVAIAKEIVRKCFGVPLVVRTVGSQLSSLHRLTRFILPKDKALAKNGCELGELKELNNIRGSLRIENLGSVTDVVAESRAANLIGKHSLESLELKWSDFDIDDAVIGNRDEALLDGLRPQSNLQKLRIEGYGGESFPRWMMDSLIFSLPKLVEVSFNGCGRCKCLPPLGQLLGLKILEVSELSELEYIVSDHSSTSTISFPSLLKLGIDGCEKLKAVPPTPHLEELWLTRAHPALINNIFGLDKLKSLLIEDMESLECVPGECWKSLTSLEYLSIWNCPGLTSLSKALPPPPLGTRHQSNLVDLDSSDSEELDLSNYDETRGGNSNNLILELHSLRSVDLLKLPKLASLPQWLLQLSNLEHLVIRVCLELDLCKDESGNNNLILDFHGGLHHSLRSLGIQRLPKLASLPQWLLQASNLEDLKIWECEELDLSKDESGGNLILDFHGGLHHSLRSLWIQHLPKLASLPQWLLHASNLEDLQIENCSNLKELPEQIEALRSLQRLEIYHCPSLTSLPEGMQRLASLTHLRIRGCPELERRCKRDGGEDWDKIAHIPRIDFEI
ncbi:hypothetical protein NL676_029749 [Syzygium grande]|nr:hypothetical protein NL676_029749 [Syzygium grande]